jgi:AP-1 complex subunit beta-1
MARKSVRVISDIAIAMPEVSKALMTSLISSYKTQKPHLVNEAMTSFAKVLKKYPKLFADLQPVLLDVERTAIVEPEAVKSFIWILGTFANQIEAAPYILEEYCENQEQFEKMEDSIKSVYLTHVVQCFLKRPPEMIKTLSRTF